MLAHPAPARSTARLAPSYRLLLVLGTVLIVAGCAASSSPVGPKQAPELGAAGGAGRDTSGGAPAFDGAAPGGVSKEAASNLVVDGVQVIRTGSLQLQVVDLRAAVDGAKTAITSLGGYISNSRESAGNNQPVATVTYRVPADKWEDGLAALRKLAIKVAGEQTDSADVSSQLVDIEARLKNLRAAETALQEIASKATRVSDVLEVQARLTEVRGQIESLAAQQKALKDRVSYATVTVTFGLQLGAVTEAATRWDPAREVDKASASLVGVLQTIAGAGIWFAIVWLPLLLVLGVLAWIGVRIGRRLGLRAPLLTGGPAGTERPPTAPSPQA